MTEQEVKIKMCAGLSDIYGLHEGFRMAGTVVPGILNDFKSMLMSAGENELVQEEYRLEDGRAVVYISGKVMKNGQLSYEKADIVRSKGFLTP